ncbi:acyltransferase [Microvirga terrae]|uniref:Acyltransferase n=1 Tax=Microvirga terrae TaxID=2740529 RepID=A0ABY5RLZ4_9HYPH|nr:MULTISPECIES: acyltransferase [Microvirga]MBQ0823074.1 acyltransferase [Microvirga sp. HBU67558]UVF17909.1 acyltransferase [Microvirga terrae]
MTEVSQRGGQSAPPSNGAHWPFLDLLRLGAALLVLFGHTRGLLFVSFQDIVQAGLTTKVFYFVTGIHREGVAIFFAVSGFLVGGGVWRSIGKSRFNPQAYFASRFARIFVVLLPALALSLLLDGIGRSYLGGTRFFGERPLMPIGVTSDWTWGQMACNLVAMQGIFCKPLGVDPPLWSLGFEWTFYLLAPLLFGIGVARLPKSVKIGAAVVLFLGLNHFAGGILRWAPWFMIWLAGTLAAQIVRDRTMPLVAGLAGLAAIATGFLVSRFQIIPPFGTDLMVGLGTALAIANRRLLSWCPIAGSVRVGADFSYSLYLIHVPVTVFLGGLLEWYGWPPVLVAPGAAPYGAFAGLLAGALITAFSFSLVTERRTGIIRNLLLRKRIEASALTRSV